MHGAFRTNYQIEKQGTSTLKEILKKYCPILEEEIANS